MEGISGVHILLNGDHESMVMGRGSPSVSFLTFTLSPSAYRPVPLVPSLESSDPRISMKRRGHSTTLDLLPGYALALSKIQTSSLFISHAANMHCLIFH
jgi:hypothetical protein